MEASPATENEPRPREDGLVRRLLRGLAGAETWHGAIVLAAFVLAFLWTPLSRYDEVYYSSADLLNDFSLMRIVPGHPAGNQLMSDEVTEMQPWAMFNRDELHAGRVPLWNPWNGAGAPHFANYQSAVFSPFTAPWYWLGTKDALLVTAFMKQYDLKAKPTATGATSSSPKPWASTALESTRRSKILAICTGLTVSGCSCGGKCRARIASRITPSNW